jgi:MFS family permease
LAVFIAASLMAFSAPSLNGAYADYVIRTPQYETEIEALQDFFTNLGYIIGPILAGFLADKTGNLNSFGFLGLLGVFIIATSKAIMPAKIRVPDKL